MPSSPFTFWGTTIGKRSSYELKPRDKYYTPLGAVKPLAEHFAEGVTYAEPCAGSGKLVEAFQEVSPNSLCVLALDIEPEAPWILECDANTLTAPQLDNCKIILTNPPFTYSVLSPLMDLWISLKPTVLLLPADFAHNKRFSKYLRVCEKIVSIGRVRWIEGTKMSSVENFAWYFFDKGKAGDTKFYGR